jgi:hypothetical protein
MGGASCNLTIGSAAAVKNGRPSLDAAPELLNHRTFVPLRFSGSEWADGGMGTMSPTRFRNSLTVVGSAQELNSLFSQRPAVVRRLGNDARPKQH